MVNLLFWKCAGYILAQKRPTRAANLLWVGRNFCGETEKDWKAIENPRWHFGRGGFRCTLVKEHTLINFYFIIPHANMQAHCVCHIAQKIPPRRRGGIFLYDSFQKRD